uniref:Uncharacterized protein n=1 Tax=Arundo donax TaxID=35708 RepID=A0A0A9H7W0_ARUDO
MVLDSEPACSFLADWCKIIE